MAQIAKKWILAKQFEGVPKRTDFRLLEEAVMFNLKPGEILLEALYLSVDPYMRWTATPGSVMPGQQIARVRVSRNTSFPEGQLVLSAAGWRSLTLVKEPEAETPLGPMAILLPDDDEFPASLGLGLFGIPGMAAYFGMLERGKPKAGETVLVSAAAGCVGSTAGQIAKNQGCFVIGSAGSKRKCKWLWELGFDEVFNYKEREVDDALNEIAPEGIDLYFDNVGGEFSHVVLENHMKAGGRVVRCGAISVYNVEEMKERSSILSITNKELDILGVNYSAYKERYTEAIAQMKEWMKKEKLQYRETVIPNIESMPRVFMALFNGGNTGKSIIKM